MTQASQRRVQYLEREQETVREVELVASERRRIARELHDIVSHEVTVILLQAAGAARIADTNFTQIAQSLAHIETRGKRAMADLRERVRAAGGNLHAGPHHNGGYRLTVTIPLADTAQRALLDRHQ